MRESWGGVAERVGGGRGGRKSPEVKWIERLEMGEIKGGRGRERVREIGERERGREKVRERGGRREKVRERRVGGRARGVKGMGERERAGGAGKYIGEGIDIERGRVVVMWEWRDAPVLTGHFC